jgi:hypothetical protein
MIAACRVTSAWLFVLSALGLVACSSPAEQAGNGTAGGRDADSGGMAGTTSGSGSAGAAGAASGGAGSENGGAGASTGGSQDPGGSGGSESGGEGNVTGEYGFAYRKPGDKNLDWLCTFTENAESGYVYVRLAVTGMTSTGLAMVPTYAVELAQISVGGKVSALTGAEYDYGGGHHNDALSFDYAGKSQRYYHSSFGFGFRSCQGMDCRSVYAAGTTTLETDGCTSDRALPEVCVSIEPDGTHAPLVDTFMKCPGDTQ